MKYLIWVIFAFGILLRTLLLSDVPLGFTPDEASFGYDAYSILKTGKDQWGVNLPLVLKSFGDYKAPLQTYLQIPFVEIMGLNKFSTRLPNALLGASSIVILYFLLKHLGKDLKYSGKKTGWLALTGSFLLCFSSWHTMMSRGAFEANLTTFLMPLGILLFLRGIKKPTLLSFSSFVFGLNLFSYHSAKFLAPIIFLLLVVFYKDKLKALGLKKLLLPLLIFLLFFMATLCTFSNGAGARVAERSIMQGALEEAFVGKTELVAKGVPYLLARVIHSKYRVFIERFINNYFQYLSPRFLFIKGPAETTYGMIPGRGVFYISEGLIFIGIFLALKRKELRKILLFFLIWIVLAPIPAALSSGVGYSANRVVIVIPAIQVVLSFCAVELFEFLQKKLSKKLMLIACATFCILIFANVSEFVKEYFINSRQILARGMLYGNLEIAEWLFQTEGDVEIQISRKLSEPHIYVAFSTKMDPVVYQEYSANWNMEESKVNWVDQIPEYQLDKYFFKNIVWKTDGLRENTLLVGKPGECPLEALISKRIDYPDGKPAIYAVGLP